MNILSATWSNADKTTVIVDTDTAGAVLVSIHEPAAAGAWHPLAVEWLEQNEPAPFAADPANERIERIETARATLRADFAKMPAAARAAFYPAHSALKAALEAQDVEAAKLIIAGIAAPPNLEAVKTKALETLNAI